MVKQINFEGARMSKIIINPEFEFLRQYIELIGENFNTLGEVLESRRNVIRRDAIMGKNVVIKSYRRIYLPNRIRYSFFASSKAQRAFDNAVTLLERGFNTPRPIAYIEVSRFGLISDSYFVSEHLDFQSLQQASDLDKGAQLISDLAYYTWRLHQNHIYHIDYSLGNILFKKSNNHFEFALVDNNRMEFGPVSVKQGIKNMVRLGLPMEQVITMAKEYTRMRKSDQTQGLSWFLKFKRKELFKRQMKQSFKGIVANLKSVGGVTAILAKSEFLSDSLVWGFDFIPF